MNERIRVLAEEAREEVSNIRMVSGQREMTWLPEAFEQRFAELIVRDCALTAGLMEHNGRKGIGAVILDNYGIKDEKDC